METTGMIREILERYWGYKTFRPMQEEIISAVLEGKDTLALMPTGGGKSVCFQVPALAREGICLVVSPLIALIKDQVQNLGARGIRALAVYSGMSYHQIDVALDNAAYGDYKFLYVSPERLQTPLFKERVRKMAVNLLVVDEAHCISQWGYDFRPAYLDIKEIRKIVGDVPVLALTATATRQVAEDIMRHLEFGQPHIIASGFRRPNLSYVVRETDDKYGHILRICRSVEGAGIVYVRERKKTAEVAAFLKGQGEAADFYHAGLSKELRTLRQDAWKKGDTRIIVATNAFGMGIDKPDVRFVIHYDLPDSVEAYFQEAGRAGRDGGRSYATLLWNRSDLNRLRQIHALTYPSPEYMKEIYQKVFIYLGIPYEEGKDSVNKFNLTEFARKFSLNAVSAYHAIRYIGQEGYWELTDETENPSRIVFTVNRDELYRVQLGSVELDSFIKSLLRLYTALFSRLTAIDEEYIARATLDSAEGVRNKLKRLAGMRILKYIPRMRTPLMIMHYERLLEANFHLSPSRYAERKERSGKRMEAMIAFTRERGVCRSRQLIAYFGQPEGEDCGICDVCIARRNHARGERRKAEIGGEILRFLHGKQRSGQPVRLADIGVLAGDEYGFYLSVLRELADRSEVEVEDEIVRLAPGAGSGTEASPGD